MSTGIFRPTPSKGLAFGTRQRGLRRAATGATLLDRFAEHLSQHGPGDPGGNVGRAASKLGRSPQWGNAMLQRMRKQLGPQAI